MASDEDVNELMLVCCRNNIACATAVLKYLICRAEKAVSKRKHRVWVSKYLALSPQLGAYGTLMRDLLELDTVKFRNYVRMDPDVFEDLFSKVEPLITTSNTRLR